MTDFKCRWEHKVGPNQDRCKAQCQFCGSERERNLAKKVEDGKIEKILTIGLGAKDVDALRKLAEGQHTKNYAVIVRRLIQKAVKGA